MKKILVLSMFCFLVFLTTSASLMPITTQSEKAKQYFIDGRDIFHLAWFEEAPAYLSKALEYDSTLAVAYIYLAMTEYFQFHDPSQSVKNSRKHAKGASQGEKWLIEGWASFINGDYLVTTKYMDSILIHYPDDDYAAHILGFSYRDAGNPEKAVEVLSALTNREAPYGPAYNHLGFSYLDLKQNDEALMAIDRFIAYYPENPSAYDSKGHLFFDLGNYEQAISYFSRATLLEKRFAYSQRFMAYALLMKAESLLARAAYYRAIDMAKTYHPIFSMSLLKDIAYTYIIENDDINTESYYLEYIKMADSLEIPGVRQTGLENLVRYFLMRENISKAKEYLEKYEELVNPGFSSSLVNYSFLNCSYLAVSRQYEKMDQIIKNNEFSDQQKFYLMGLRFEYQGNLKEAMEQYLLIEDPDLYTISRLKNLATRLNEFDLIEKLDKQQKSKKSYPDLSYALSVAYARNANDM